MVPTKKLHKNLTLQLGVYGPLPAWSSPCMVHASLVSRFPWSLNLTQSTVHSWSPICLPYLISSMPCLDFSSMLTCASVVFWSHMYSHIHACMISYGSACIPSLVCVCGLVYICFSGHLCLILVLHYSLLYALALYSISYVHLCFSHVMQPDPYFKKAHSLLCFPSLLYASLVSYISYTLSWFPIPCHGFLYLVLVSYTFSWFLYYAYLCIICFKYSQSHKQHIASSQLLSSKKVDYKNLVQWTYGPL